MNGKLKLVLRSKTTWLCVLYLLVFGLSLFRVWQLGLMPVKYLAIFGVIGLLLFLIILRLVTYHLKRIKVGGFLLLLISVLAMFWATLQASGIGDFFSSQKTAVQKRTIEIIVLKKAPYQSVTELKKENIAAPSEVDAENIKKLEQSIERDFSVQLRYKKTNSYVDAANALMSKESPAMVLNSDYRAMVENAIPNFADKTRILYSISLEEEVHLTHNIGDIATEPFNIYLSGNDQFGDLTAEGRSDTNIIASVNPKTREILLTSVPRDYYVEMAISQPGAYDKLTHASNFGTKASVETLENLLDIKISYYIKINFSSLIKIVDAVDGIRVDNPEAFNTYDISELPFDFPKGNIELSGKQALAYSRERYFFGDERVRGQNQQRVIAGLIQKITSPEYIINFGTILSNLGNIYETNLTQDEIGSLIRMQLDDNRPWKIQSISLNGAGATGYYSYMMPDAALYVMMPYKETIDYAKECIEKIFKGTAFTVTDKYYEPVNPTILDGNTNAPVTPYSPPTSPEPETNYYQPPTPTRPVETPDVPVEPAPAVEPETPSATPVEPPAPTPTEPQPPVAPVTPPPESPVAPDGN
ncbi:MAG: LCP family protein [Eubacteriales bacterium]|nr:LCP family protein [Eubacteriales bacterium]